MVTSCGPSKEVKQKKELEKLAKQVMDAHDRTMDKDHYGQLRILDGRLLNIEIEQTDSNVKNELVNAALDLQKADRAMMNWMHEYTVPADFLPFEEQKTYYIEEKKKIEDIEKQTNEAIDRAKELIEKYGK